MWKNLKGKDHSNQTNDRIILKVILHKYDGVDWIRLAHYTNHLCYTPNVFLKKVGVNQNGVNKKIIFP
jgi:hypothetical protein